MAERHTKKGVALSNVTGIVFDCDGTLLDSMGAWRGLERDLAREVNIELTAEDVDALNVMTIPEVGDYYFQKFGLGASGNDVVEMIDTYMAEHYGTLSVLRPGVKSFVEQMAEHGIKMSVASSTPHHLLEIALGAVGLAPYLEAIVSVDDVGHSKREPHTFDAAREAMGTSLDNTVVFEDSLYAVHTALKAGYKTVGIYDCDEAGTWDDLEGAAHVTFRSFEDIDANRFISGGYWV